MRLRTTLPAALLALVAVPALAASFTRPPALQNATPSGMTFVFRTDASCAPRVVAAATDGAEIATTGTATTRHEVRLAGLATGARYQYRVEACGAVATGTFATAPVPGTQSVHFAAVGDAGVNSSNQKALGDRMLASGSDVLLHLGDGAYDNGTESEVQTKLFAPWTNLLARVPMYMALGNHEYVTEQGKPTLDSLALPTNPKGNERYYSFDYGHVHFVALDSNCVVDNLGAACSETDMLGWLEDDLAKTTQPWKVVFFHHPPWSNGEHGSITEARAAISPILERHGVDLVLNGHDHDYERTKPMKGTKVVGAGEGPTYVVVGTGGAKLKSFSGRPDWSVIQLSDTNAYLDVTVEGGSLVARLVSTSNQVLDTFTLTKEVGAPVDPGPTDPGPIDPGPIDPGPIDPGPTDPGPTDPGPTDPTPTDPTPTDPTDPTPTDPTPSTPGSGCNEAAASGLIGFAALGLSVAFRRRRR